MKEEGYEVVLVNSNPATIMTDPEMADRTYIEPITPEIVEKIIVKSGRMPCFPPSAARRRLTWPSVLAEKGVLDKSMALSMIGADYDAIQEGGGPGAFQRGHAAHRPGGAAKRPRPHHGGGP